MSDDTAGRLQTRVEHIRDLAAAGQPDAVHSKLAELRAIVREFQGQGRISARTAEAILAAADAVDAQLSLITTTTPETTTSTSLVTTTSPPEEEEKKEEDSRGRGNNNDKADKGGSGKDD